MLLILSQLQWVLYVALLAMAGQGVLYVLVGAQRERNVFYRLLRAVSIPFTGLVRRLASARLTPARVGLLSFALVALAYVVVTIARIDACLHAGLALCR